MYRILVILLLFGVAAICLAVDSIPIDETIAKLNNEFYLTRRAAEFLLSANLSDPQVLAKVKEVSEKSTTEEKNACIRILNKFYDVSSSDPEIPIVNIRFLPDKFRYKEDGPKKIDIVEKYLKRAEDT